MKKIKGYLLWINLVALLIYFNFSVWNKENILESGQLILLELAPVDPRSLMQGDYMRLNYNLGERLERGALPKRGYCVLQVDKNNRATVVRFQENPTPLHPGELLLKYTSPNGWPVQLGAESYFFQEGQAHKFAKATYGGLKVDKKGNSLLIGLYDEKLNQIR